jgi:cysteine desulfurase
MSKIYLDYAATTPTKSAVLKAAQPFFSKFFGNPSSIHSFGRITREAIDESRSQIAKFFNCENNEIIFTSGATESDNLAIFGIAKAKKSQGNHIITTQIEHHAVLESCKKLEKDGYKVTYLPVSKNGVIDIKTLEKSITTKTILVSIMYVNNETGVVQPIREIGKMLKKINKTRKNKIIFHTDAVQAIQSQNCNVQFLHCEALSFSGHKIGASKGIGGLFLRKGTPITPQIFGGHHELNLRAGTENVTGIVALSKAIELINKKDIKYLANLQKYFEAKIKKTIPNIQTTGVKVNRAPHISNISFDFVEGESVLINLDLEGIAVSTGSACASGALEPSHVLMAMHHDPLKAHGSVRFSFGIETKKSELDLVIKKLISIIKRLRKISPYKR